MLANLANMNFECWIPDLMLDSRLNLRNILLFFLLNAKQEV